MRSHLSNPKKQVASAVGQNNIFWTLKWHFVFFFILPDDEKLKEVVKDVSGR